VSERHDTVAALYELARADGRYAPEAYLFVKEGVDFSARQLGRPGEHMSGQELAAGLRDFALEQFGPMALTVLQEWGICRTDDFGEIVFAMIRRQILAASESDSPADFCGVFDLREACEAPFRPVSMPSDAGLPHIV
jgi:uncharacterized repeat protein (TIGR04138 family)